MNKESRSGEMVFFSNAGYISEGFLHAWLQRNSSGQIISVSLQGVSAEYLNFSWNILFCALQGASVQQYYYSAGCCAARTDVCVALGAWAQFVLRPCCPAHMSSLIKLSFIALPDLHLLKAITILIFIFLTLSLHKQQSEGSAAVWTSSLIKELL